MILRRFSMAWSSHKSQLFRIVNLIRSAVVFLLLGLLILTLVSMVGLVDYALLISSPKMPQELVWSQQFLNWTVWFVVFLYWLILHLVFIQVFLWKPFVSLLETLASKLKQMMRVLRQSESHNSQPSQQTSEGVSG